MVSVVTKWLAGGGDVLMRINKPGTGQVSQITKTLHGDGIIPRVFTFITPASSSGFKENINSVINSGGKYVILDFDLPLNLEIIEDMKKSINLAKEAGLKVITVVKTPRVGVGVQNSELHYFSTTEQLFSSLEHCCVEKNPLLDNVIGIIRNGRSKVGLNSVENGSKPKMK